MPFVILSAGRDSGLLKKRNTALVSKGYKIASALDPSESVDKLLNGDFDLVLLCDSMPDADHRRLAHIITSYSPSTPVVLICESLSDRDESGAPTLKCPPDRILDVVAHSLSPAVPVPCSERGI